MGHHMTIDFARISDATRLVRSGQLRAATAAIQAALSGRAAPPAAPATAFAAAPDVIDVPSRVLPPEVHQSGASPQRDERDAEHAPEVAATGGARAPSAGQRFVAGSFSNGHDRRDYKFFVPAQAGERPLPLVVMLHGCTQDPDDFAAGTGMNELAESRGFYVLYPAQSRQANPQGCWNWFKHTHQQRDRGEPALLAGMTRQLMAQHRIDPDRVYVAGLSAGGAMAAILGETYPDLYAAVGVHSGLASGSALDLPSALSAMKGAARSPAGMPSGVPTIVFHGDADGTVHVRNGEHVIAASIGATASVEVSAVEDPGVRNATRAVYRAADGRIIAERWTVHGASHAWSGGKAQGSYTDRQGPDASAQMLRFFFEHPRRERDAQEPVPSRRRA